VPKHVNPAPAIAALSPGNVQAGGGPPLTLTVNGAGFVGSSTVQVNGVARPTIFVSSNILTTQISAADIAAPGTLQVAVATGAPGGGTSAPAALTIANYAAPSITALAPNSISIGSPNTVIDVTGAGFTATSAVQINGGSPITPNSWSPYELFLRCLPLT
jgi:trimeric autotransporter adhesin